MNKQTEKLLKRIAQRPIDPLRLQLMRLKNIKALYEQNLNLPSNVKMANVQLVQNDIITLKKKLRRRTGKGLVDLSRKKSKIKKNEL